MAQGSQLPEKIFPVEYAGFFDFNEKGVDDTSVINAEDYPNAKEIANEISKRYNSHDELVKFVKEVYKLSTYKENHDTIMYDFKEIHDKTEKLLESLK